MPKKSNTVKKGGVTVKRLPSGSWNARVYDYTDENGKDHFRSFTDPDQNRLILTVNQYKLDRERARKENRDRPAHITVGEAMDRVIRSKEAVWSPTTYLSNSAIRRNNLQRLMPVYVDELTQEQIQIAVNEEAATHAPKTVRNMHGFLVSVIKVYRPDFTVTTTLPQKVKPKISIPTEEEVKALLEASRDTPMELPIILAAICGMRRSEIAGLTRECLDFDRRTITIREALVRSKDTTWTTKTTKTVESTRTIRMMPPAYDALKRLTASQAPEVPLVSLTPNKITERFTALTKSNDLPHYRFHDLRHFCVSAMIGQGIPVEYVIRYVGHNSSKMVETVYFHVMQSVRTKAEDTMEAFYNQIFS